MTRKDVLAMDYLTLDKTVKIQGTRFDRKRKVSNSDIVRMKKLRARGDTLQSIAEKVGCCKMTVKYHTNPEWRENYNKTRNGKHYGNKVTYSVSDRSAYKRDLVATRKIRSFA